MLSENTGQSHWSKKRLALHPSVANLHAEGLSAAEIARRLGISDFRAVSCFEDLGLPRRTAAEIGKIKGDKSRALRTAARKPLLESVKRLYDEGLSVIQISRQLSVGRGQINSCIADLGLDRRNGSEANLLRFARMTPEQRRELALSAHDKRANCVRSDAELTAEAIRKQHTMERVGILEADVAECLRSKHLECIPQFAWKRYNFDIMVGHLAVEVHSGPMRPINTSGELRKTTEALSAGISMLYLWLRNRATFNDLAIDEIVAFHKLTRRKPSPLGQYRVVRGDGKIDTASNDKLDEFAAIVARYHSLKTSRGDPR